MLLAQLRTFAHCRLGMAGHQSNYLTFLMFLFSLHGRVGHLHQLDDNAYSPELQRS